MNATNDSEYEYRLWHARLGNLGDKSLKALMKVGKMPMSHVKMSMRKQTRVRFQSSSEKSKGILDLVHSDVWGPSPHPNRGGALYFVTFIDIDDFSQKAPCIRNLKYLQSSTVWKALI